MPSIEQHLGIFFTVSFPGRIAFGLSMWLEDYVKFLLFLSEKNYERIAVFPMYLYIYAM